MFARIRKSGCSEYLQIVENRRVGVKTAQRVICTIGRMDQVHAKGSIKTLERSLPLFSEDVHYNYEAWMRIFLRLQTYKALFCQTDPSQLRR